MEIQIVLTCDSSFFSRLARLLGAEYTHCMLRHPQLVRARVGLIGTPTVQLTQYSIIEATMRRGVIERAWRPEEYSKYAVYGLKPEYVARNTHQRILDYARGNVGKWYAFDKLIMLIPQFLRARLHRFMWSRGTRSTNQFSIIFSGERAHICSSLVDDSFFAAGHDLVRRMKEPWVLPDDIRDSPLLELLPPEGTIEWERSKK